MKIFWKVLLAILALGVFGWYIRRLGPSQVWEVIAGIGAWAPLILVPYFVVYLVDCLGWSETLPPGKVPFWTLFRVRWAGESLNNLVPTAYVGGETAKVLMLRPFGVSARDGAVSAVVSKTAQTVAQLVFIVAASAVFFHLAQEQPRLRLGIICILTAGGLAVGALFLVQRIGIFRIFLAAVQVFPFQIKRLDSKKQRLLEIDQTIFGFYRNQPRRFYRSIFFYLCGWTLDTLEIYFVAHLLGVPMSWAQALVMEAFTGVAKALGMWLPGSLGVQESGIVLMGRLTGLSDTFSAAYALIRRGRELVFSAVGMLLLYFEKAGERHGSAENIERERREQKPEGEPSRKN